MKNMIKTESYDEAYEALKSGLYVELKDFNKWKHVEIHDDKIINVALNVPVFWHPGRQFRIEVPEVEQMICPKADECKFYGYCNHRKKHTRKESCFQRCYVNDATCIPFSESKKGCMTDYVNPVSETTFIGHIKEDVSDKGFVDVVPTINEYGDYIVPTWGVSSVLLSNAINRKNFIGYVWRYSDGSELINNQCAMWRDEDDELWGEWYDGRTKEYCKAVRFSTADTVNVRLAT